MTLPVRLIAAILFLLAFSASASASDDRPISSASLAGTWACQSVYGGPFTGRACHTWPQLMLRADGTYTWGSEQGTWEVQEQQLHLSGRTGHLDENGKLIVEYEVKGTHYRQTLFRR